MDFDIEDIFDYEPTLEGANAINSFMEEEWFDICQEQGLDELSYFQKNRKELPFNESDNKPAVPNETDYTDPKHNKPKEEDTSLKTKVVKLFTSILEKLKMMMDKFLKILSQYLATDKQFITRYEKKIKDADLSRFKFEGYNFTLDGEHTVESADKRLDTVLLDPDDNLSKEEIGSIIRGTILNKKQDVSSSDYGKELFKYFRNNTDVKTFIQINKDDIVNEIKSANDSRKKTIDAYNSVKKAINDKITMIKNETKFTNAKKKVDIRWEIDVLKIFISVLQIYNANYLFALKARNRQNKAVAIKLITQEQQESYSFI